MSSKPIIDPSIPYIGEIDGGFKPGQLLRIQGFVPPNSERFNVNLQTGPNVSPRDDVSLHISVRLLEGYVARNSLEGGNWGDEQGQGKLPIFPGQKFEIIVLCESNKYKIAINGQHYCEFPQRVSHTRVTHLSISGDVQINLIVTESLGPAPEQRSGAVPQNAAFGEKLPEGFEPNAPPAQGPPGSQPGGFGPPQGNFAPPQGNYGPPQGNYGPLPQGNYGPPQGGYGQPQGGYGAPQGGYGPPPPPPQGKEESGFEGFLESASSALMGAIGSGAADKLIGVISGGGSNPNQQQYPQGGNPYQQQPPQQQQQPAFHPSQVGGQGSVGGLGSVGSLLTSFAEDLLSGKKAMAMPPLPKFGNAQSNVNTVYPKSFGFTTHPDPSNPTHPHPNSSIPLANVGYPNHPPYPRQPPFPGQPPSTFPGQPPNTNNQPYPNSSPYPTNPSFPNQGLPPSHQGMPPYPPHFNNPYGIAHPSTNHPIPPLPPAPNTYGHHGLPPGAYAPGSYPSTTSICYNKPKKSKMKKAMKYGLPVVGAGVGGYMLASAIGHHHSSSSSSSSSSSD